MDDGDFEHICLPSPDGDIEIIPGFRDKYHEALSQPGGTVLTIASFFAARHKFSNGAEDEESAPLERGFRQSPSGKGVSGRGGTNPKSLKGGGSSWIFFLIQKKGLGLNQTQLKSLYQAQIQSRFLSVSVYPVYP